MTAVPPSLLVLGAGRGQVGLIRAARARGYYVLVATLPSKTAPGIPLADEVVEVDISDPDAVEAAVSERAVSGVVTSCMDTGLRALGRVRDRHGLVGLNETAAIRCGDKLEMKRALVTAGVSTADYRVLRDEDELDEALNALGLPVVIKPVDLQGSQGVTIAHTHEQALRGLSNALTVSRRGYVIIEEFIKGTEIGAQALVCHGEIVFILPHGDKIQVTTTAIPVGHHVPLEMSQESLTAAITVTRGAIQALGLDDCAVNVDLIVRGDEAYIIELTGRVGANGLTELVSEHFGVDYYDTVVGLAMGETPTSALDGSGVGRRPAVAVRMLTAPGISGKLTKLSIDEQRAPETSVYTFFRGEGDIIDGFTSSTDCLGQVVVSAPTTREALHRADLAEGAIELAVS